MVYELHKNRFTENACLVRFMESVLLHGENAQSDEDDGDSE